MNRLPFTLILLSLCCWKASSQTTLSLPETSIYAMYTGTTPCGPGIRPLHKVSAQAECALVEWNLTLYQHPVTHQATTYTLSSINKYGVAVTNQYSEPGIKIETTGSWIQMKNSRKSGSFIYQLDPDKPSISVRFVTLSDQLIHVLDHDGNLMTGNPFWNYTLSRLFPSNTKGQISTSQLERLPENVVMATSHKNILFGDFEGRIPCKEIAAELGMKVSMACDKRKIRLLFYEDAVTHAPTTYKLTGMGELSGEGNWKIVKGMESDPDAIVFQLDMKNKMLYLYKGNDNVLFFLDHQKRFLPGNAHYSYTINRIMNENSWSHWRDLANKGLSF